MPTMPIATPARSPRRRALLLALTLTLMAFGAAFSPTPAEAGSGEKCVTYHFEYTDGHTDSDTECSSPSTPGMNLTQGLHVSSLHISCSDTFGTEVRDGGDLVGYTSDGGSNLDGHVIAVEGGVPQWGISKDWTGGDGLDCGHVVPTPTPDPEPECEGPVVIEVRDADTGELVTGAAAGTFDGDTLSLDADGITSAGTFDCDTEHTATLTSPPAGYEVVDGTDSGTLVDADEDGTAETLTLVLTVEQPEPDPEPECEGPVVIEVRDADTGELVTGAAAGTFDGDTLSLDADGITSAGTFDCDTEHTATLTSPPAGYEVVDGTDSGTLVDADEDGTAETLTLVLTVQQPAPGTDPDPDTDPDQGTDPAPDTGVGGDEVVCEGRMEVIVIGPGGGEVDGPVTLDGEPIMTPHDTGTVECGAYTAVLDVDALPDGVTLGSVTNSDTVGPDSGAIQSVTIEDGDEDQVVFVLALTPSGAEDLQPAPDLVEVSPDAAPDTSDDAPPAAAQDTADQLPQTGAQYVALLVLALLMLAGGGSTLRLGRTVR